MKIFDEEKIKTYRNLEELVSSNVLVGRRDGLLLGIDERTIDELRNYMYKANMYDKQKEVLDKIKEYIKENSKNISITPNSVKAVPVEYIYKLLEEIE